MKRLTMRNSDGKVSRPYGVTVDEVFYRLSEYEDTGLEPEEINELCTDDVAEVAKMFRKMIESGEINHLQDLLQAENDGRIVVLPCKVGDAVWAIRSYQGHKHPQKGFVKEMYFLPDMTLHIVVKHIARGEFGKAVFFTREEAEAALAKKGCNQ